MADHLLTIAMPAAIGLHILILQERGGPSAEDMNCLLDAGRILAEHGDELLFRPKKSGRTAEVFNQVAAAVAVLSFIPGGVTFLGQHYESKKE